ncbi:oligosaccharide flippase family protein [Paracoccus amoyensis]|uniref:oligosaccharide flippase family protein n=1 Tax=Paracoccus amoyensis TaxID=2760093 RepID=UPI00165953C4
MRFSDILKGEGLRSRALRGTAITLGGTFGSQLMRLLSNLILTRLLFPEAFGLMALIQTFMTALQMFSDIGIRVSIIQNPRGEESDFLNTAWTLQIFRGMVLWLVACALAWPLASFYDEPQIRWLLPVVGLNAVVMGFLSTKMAVQNRRLRLGRQTVISLVSQAGAVILMVALAAVWPSVWALVIGGLFGNLMTVLASHIYLPGAPSRLKWDRSAAHDLMKFGQFIFISTLAGFFVNQGDKLVLGKLVSFTDLGIYNIAFFMAAFPTMLGRTVAERILFPLYRHARPSENPVNRHKIGRARNLVAGGMLAMFGTLALIGNLLIGLLYDVRYAAAGPMLIIMALAQIPTALTLGNSQLLLAEGDSRRFSRLVVLHAILNFILMLGGFWLLGMLGILLVQGVQILIIYPLQQYYLSRYKGTHLREDAVFALAGVMIAAVAIWLNWGVLSAFCSTSVAAAPIQTGSWATVSLFH